MKDTKFYVEFSAILSLIAIALYILNFVSFKSEVQSEINSNFLLKLSSIECDISNFDFKKEISKAKVVVVEKEIKLPIPVPKVKKIKVFKNKVLITSNKIEKPTKKKRDKLFVFKKLKNSFLKTNDYKIALKLSRLFYTSKRYKKALKWSMIANELNKKDDSSWILFAKAKLKLGDKKVAKMALKSYQRVYNSKKVTKLLSRISS